MRTIFRHRWMRIVSMTFITLHLSLITSIAQTSLYEKNMQLGEMFKNSGNLLLAEKYFQAAIDNTENELELLSANLHWVDIMKFSQPVKAQRLNDHCEEPSRQMPDYRQIYLAMNGFISFQLNNKSAFNNAYEEYLNLCQQYDSLPDYYDIPMKAMHEALEGYTNEALETLSSQKLDGLTRHDLRILFYEKNGELEKAIDEQNKRCQTIDSMSAAAYERNLKEIQTTANMTHAQKEAEQSSSKKLTVIFVLLAVIALMLAYWLNTKKNIKKLLAKKDKQLTTALIMAGETEDMKKEFVRRVSHEIRTPLNAISGFNEILNNTEIELSKEERKDMLARINENVVAITSIIDKMLQIADEESTLSYPKNDTILCNQFFSNLLYKYSSQVSANIELKYTTHVINRFTIYTNMEAVENIVEHLINNAIKFTQNGSIELNCSEKRGMLYLTLTDTGCGIPADKQDEIFEQFAKGDDFKQGIGLGLTIGRNVAHKLGGDLVLDKEYNTGARFILSIPVK